jgi:hypothetical protein
MKIITLGLAIAFFVLAFMVIGGSFNFFNASKEGMKKSMNVNCVEISYDVTDIEYIDGNLSFFVKQNNDFSNKPVNGVQIRFDSEDSFVSVPMTRPLVQGMSEKKSINIELPDSNMFFVSALGCPIDYEKRCYVEKTRCE